MVMYPKLNFILRTIHFLAAIGALSFAALSAAELPGDRQQTPIVLVGGTVHRIDGASEVADLVFDEGRIVAIGTDIAIPKDAERVDVQGQHVFPGLIDADSAIGLIEVDAVRATDDMREIGLINPNVQASIAFNPDTEMIPVTRANGILFANVVPRGSFVTGRSSLLMLDGWNVQDMTARKQTGLHIRWPRIESGEARNERLDELDKLLDDARAYHSLRKAEETAEFDTRLEAMGAVLAKKTAVFAHADSLSSIQSAVAFAVKNDLRLVIVGGYDAPDAAKLLKRNKVPVVVNGTLRLPRQRHAAYNEPFTVPQRLHAAGIKFCIGGEGRFGASNARNLPYHAGAAVAHGLPVDIALRSVTLSAAEILGAAKRIGSLTKGKDATLFVANGNILEVSTQVSRAFVQGRAVSLENRHSRLYDKFRTKHQRKND